MGTADLTAAVPETALWITEERQWNRPAIASLIPQRQ